MIRTSDRIDLAVASGLRPGPQRPYCAHHNWWGRGIGADAKTLEVRIWRGGPEGGKFQVFEVPREENQTILDVVSWVQQNAEPALAYRFACRVGMCGSCAMTVNGRARWTCRTHVQKVARGGRLDIAPLKNLPVLKDLATDMDPFFDKWTAAGGTHAARAARTDEIAAIDPESNNRTAASAGIECINCAICYSSCDTVAGNADYLGPAALNRVWTLLNDEKDARGSGVLDGVLGMGGAMNCHSIGACSALCPNDLDPLAAIAGLKRAAVGRALRARDA